MGSNNTTRAIPMIVTTLVLILLSSAVGAQADSGEASPSAMARRDAGPVPPPTQPPQPSSDPDEDCPLVTVPAVINACRRPPGLAACAAQCVVYHYRGGYCDVQPNGRPGDCFCTNCLGLAGGQRRLG